MKLHGSAAILFLLFLFNAGAYAQESPFEQFSNQFELKSFTSLHIYLPITWSSDFSPLDPYPFKGRKIDASLLAVMGIKPGGYEIYYALYKFYITPSVMGFMIRRGGDAQFFDSSLDLYIYNRKTGRLIQMVSLAGYAHGESGGMFWAGWLQDINNDGAPDIITRERSGPWEELESPLNDSITVHMWHAEAYIKYIPQNKARFLESYPVFFNPFGADCVSAADVDKKLEQEKQVYKIVLSSDMDLEAARFEEHRFEGTDKSHASTIFFSDMLDCSIYKRKDRFYTVISGDFSRNKAELILMDLKEIFPTAWIEDERMWCPDVIYTKKGYWECSE
jgi:hypothetical protein